MNLSSNETIQKIAKKHKKSAAQVILKWNVQRGVIVIPKSVHAERLKENINIFDFELDEDDMKVIDSMNQKKR